MRQKAIDVLLNLGVSMANKGFVYLCDCIEVASADDRYLTDTYELYKQIANKRKTTIGAVEAIIRYEITNIFTKASDEKLVNVFGTSEKLSNASAIAGLYMYLRKGE